MSIATFTPFTVSEIDEILTQNQDIVQKSLQLSSGKQRFQLTLPDRLLTTLSQLLNIPLTNPLPAQVVKGDTAIHTDQCPFTFAATYLLYLTSSPGSLVLADYSYPIEQGTLYRFPSGIHHGTTGTGDSIRLSLGPFNEFQHPVGASGFLYYIYDTYPGTLVADVFQAWSDPYTVLTYTAAGNVYTPVVPPNQEFIGWTTDASGTTVVEYTAGQSISVANLGYLLYPLFQNIPQPSSTNCLDTCASFGPYVQNSDRTSKDKEEYVQNKAIYVDHETNMNPFGQRRQFADYSSYMQYISAKAKINSKQNQ